MSVGAHHGAMEPTEVVGKGETHLHGEAWVPDGTLRAVLVLAHGKDEHIGRYHHVVSALNDRGYAVYCHDHRGHGKSDGVRGAIGRFDDYVDDLDLLVELARSGHPAAPVYLVGHSMGGLIAGRYALQYQDKLAGLILSAPALRLGDEVPGWQKRVLLLLGRFFPAKTLPSREPGILSRDPQVEAAFRADPLCIHEPTKLGSARSLFLAAEATRSRGSELTLPLLVMHGEADKLTSPLGSKAFYEQAVSSDKAFKLWPEDRHEIFNELDKSEVIAFLVAWLNARTVSHAG